MRLGREDAVRTDALPYLVTRAVDSNIRPNDTAVAERKRRCQSFNPGLNV